MTDAVDGLTAEAPTLHIPRGELLRARVVSDPATPLEAALDRELTGYATIVPQDTLLLDGDARGVVTFADGVPVLAYNTATDAGGADALAALAVSGPYRIELYRVAAEHLREAHEATALVVPPDAPAAELAGDQALAARTREAAPSSRLGGGRDEEPSAVEAFLADDDRIEAIREQARAEAAERAAEWGLDGALGDDRGDEALSDDQGDEALGDHR